MKYAKLGPVFIGQLDYTYLQLNEPLLNHLLDSLHLEAVAVLQLHDGATDITAVSLGSQASTAFDLRTTIFPSRTDLVQELQANNTYRLDSGPKPLCWWWLLLVIQNDAKYLKND